MMCLKTFMLFFSGVLPVWSQVVIDELMTNSPSSQRINIVVLAEGYRADQAAQFTTHAAKLMDRLFATTPFIEYRTYFNAWALFVPSEEAGSDHPDRGVYRNTYFNSTYDSYGVQRVLTIPPNDWDSSYAHGRGKVEELLAAYFPECDLTFLMVNDEEYGGSGGPVIIASAHASSAEIGIHELGHSFAGLGDEYGGSFPGYPDAEEPNTTRETDPRLIKWRSWIEPGTPIPTPETSSYRGLVGLFEGAHYHDVGWYRPKLDCKMRTLTAPFCEVCTEAIVLATYEYVSPIESGEPASGLMTITGSEQATFRVNPVRPVDPRQMRIEWMLNDRLISDATNFVLSLTASSLVPGTNTVAATIRDVTTKVRDDPTLLLQESRTWTVIKLLEPKLHVHFDGTDITVRWPSVFPGFVPEQASALFVNPSWSEVKEPVALVGDWFTVKTSLSGEARWFRLRASE